MPPTRAISFSNVRPTSNVDAANCFTDPASLSTASAASVPIVTSKMPPKRFVFLPDSSSTLSNLTNAPSARFKPVTAPLASTTSSMVTGVAMGRVG